MKINRRVLAIIGVILIFTSSFLMHKNASSNAPPVADFSFTPSIPSPNETVTFNASISYDSDGYITNWQWNFGDGSIGYGIVVNHSYNKNGTYNVTLTVTDNDGISNSKLVEIVVDIPPVANFTYDINKNTATFNASISYDSDGYITNYTWEFGDGSIGYKKNVSHQYLHEGIYNVCLEVRDNIGKSEIKCQNISIDILPPHTHYYLIPPSPNGDAGWYISHVGIKLEAFDNVSGINVTKYKIDIGGWNDYNGTIDIGDGRHTIAFYSIDNEGNSENEKYIYINCDTIPPFTRYYIDKDDINGWYRESANVTLYGRDSLSRLYATYYFLDGILHRYSGEIKIGNGKHLLAYYSVDRAGNGEKVKTLEIDVDNETPLVDILSPSEGIYLFGRKIISYEHAVIIGNITIKVSVYDGLSGVKHVDFYIDNTLRYSDNTPPYSWIWNEPKIGSHEIKVIAYDMVGNEARKSMDVFIVNL